FGPAVPSWTTQPSPNTETIAENQNSRVIYGVKREIRANYRVPCDIRNISSEKNVLIGPIRIDLSTGTMMRKYTASNYIPSRYIALHYSTNDGTIPAWGYHLVSIGDKLQDRYRVVHKIGHGGYSTTWLARDERSQNLAAIKVGTAESNPREVNVLSALDTTKDTTLRRGYGGVAIPSILDRFDIQGRNGIHPCYVAAPGQATIYEALEASDSGMFELNVARALVAQLALAVSFIQSQGIAHGDEQLYEKYGPPTMEPVVRFDSQELPAGIPTHGTVPVWLGKPSDEVRLIEAKVLLIDFGEAFEPSREEKYVSHTPLCIRPPEARFEPAEALSFPSDVWSLACAIWSILGQRPLFDPWFASSDDVSKWFDDNGVPLEHREGVYSLEDRFRFSMQEPQQKEGMGLFEQDEQEALLAMLRSMLVYKPGDRSTAGEVLDSEWMRKWAMPEMEDRDNNIGPIPPCPSDGNYRTITPASPTIRTANAKDN
ncbi:hypothetical protein V500_09939, partial [Pseudogymnoascus sp. VKM F-4518 (FW-2643)]